MESDRVCQKTFWTRTNYHLFFFFSLAGFFWGLQSISFSQQTGFAPFALILGAPLLSLAHFFSQSNKNFFSFVKIFISYFFAFMASNIFSYETFLLSRQHKIIFRFFGASDSLSGSILNSRPLILADTWLTFVIFGFVLFSLLQLLDNFYHFKKILKATLILTFGAFLAPILANFITLAFNWPFLSPVLSLIFFSLLIAYLINEKPSVTLEA